MLAMDDAGTAGGGAGELDCRFHRLGAGIGEKHLVEIRRKADEALRQQSGKRRHVELHETRQFRVEHALERVAQRRVIAPDREHAVAAQQVEIFRALAVEQILPGAAAEADIIAQRFQHAHHLLVEMTRVGGKAIGFAFGVELRNIQAHDIPIDQPRPESV